MSEKPRKRKPRASSKEKTSGYIGKFPIVGIGASAGGLEALEQFLQNVPEKNGMSYVVIQHLDPTQKGMLPELLQRVTQMKVSQVTDRLKVNPNCVYVIPPNKSMSILKGVLYLFEPVEARGMRLPIDFFFRSLADDRHELSIGVILSGMGSDGSIGLSAIKEKGGIVMVQDPATAKFDSMPRNAINSVVVDIVAPANKLIGSLVDFLKHTSVVKTEMDVDIKDKSSLDKIIILLRTQTGNDFSLYKKNTVYRRIERRMSVHKINKISNYVRFLQDNPKEVNILFKELMIGVTNFFRDPTVWEYLTDKIFPNILANLQPGSVLRAWIVGCSTGEEAYSLAIVFKEAIEKFFPNGGFALQIFATDLDNIAIDTARKGIYPLNIAGDVTKDRLSRYFIASDDGYRVSSEIREMVVFAQHNIIMHPPFTKIDVLLCRNLLIYMDSELQKKLLGLFFYSLNHEGILLLGGAETIGTQSNLFTPVDSKLKIYRRSDSSDSNILFDFPSSFSRTKKTDIVNQKPVRSNMSIQTLTDQLLLEHFSPAGVLVNENGDIIYISGHTGKYLEPAVGKANMNIFAMLREDLRNQFPAAFRKCIMKKETVILHDLKVGTNGGKQNININITWIEKPDPLNGLLIIVFIPVPVISNINLQEKTGKKTQTSVREADLEKELRQAHEEMQNTLEEMQTSQEELKSTNEELQSTNEELQSTNEELTTSKEEMQSLNEELQTVNAELQSKVDDFMRVNNDMKNLLNSTDIATLFLDKELNIRRFTNQATKIFKLIKSDIGRPLTDLDSGLIYPELADDSFEVLRTLVFVQKQVPSKDGKWFSIRIMPYRTSDDRIDGLVLTFINLTDLKEVEVKLHETEQINQLLLNSFSDVIIKLSIDGKIEEFNSEAENFFGKKREDVLNQSFIQIFIPEPVQKKTERHLKKYINRAMAGKFNIQVIAAGGNIPVVELSVNILLDNLKLAKGMIIITKNI